jgi:hypothetical protein
LPGPVARGPSRYKTVAMKIYELDLPTDSEWAIFYGSDGTSPWLDLRGQSVRTTWSPAVVRLLTVTDAREHLLESDMPWAAPNSPVMRSSVVPLVAHLFDRDAELLPLACDTADLVLANVTTVLPAVDMERSEIAHFKTSGRIQDLVRPVFDAAVIGSALMFRVECLPARVYVTEEFVQGIRASGIRSTDFKLVYDEDDVGVSGSLST